MSEYIVGVIKSKEGNKVVIEGYGSFIVANNIYDKFVKLKEGQKIIFANTPDGIITWIKKFDPKYSDKLAGKGLMTKAIEYDYERFKDKLKFRLELFKIIIDKYGDKDLEEIKNIQLFFEKEIFNIRRKEISIDEMLDLKKEE